MSRSFSFQSSRFFVVRLPLFPLDALVRWGEGARAPAALAQGEAALEAAVAGDRQRLVAGLRAHLEQPAVREALFVASPSLDEALTTDLDGPGVTSIVARYFARLTARATPFGLFASTGVGAVVPGSGLRLDPDGPLVRHTRLDMEYVSALADALERRPEVRTQLRFAPNSSLHELAGQLRVIEGRLDPVTGDRRNDLVAIEATASVRAVVLAAAGGATPPVLAGALVAARPGVSPEQAAGFVASLIDSRVLVSELAPAVTGANPLDEMIATLARLPDQAGVTAVLARVRDGLAALDRDGLGVAPVRYRAIAAELAALPAPVELRRLFQVDLYRQDPRATLGEAVLAEISAAVEVLTRIGATPAPAGLARFRERFAERYEQRAVPLVEALDEDLGIGFPAAEGLWSDPAPLLDGLEFPSGPAGDAPFTAADAWKLRRLLGAGAAPIWSLDEEDLTALARPAAPLPDAFAVLATLAAPAPEALDQGEYTVMLRGASGPSGARLFGRFCHGHPVLRTEVEAHLRAEEARRPDAIFAEVVHLPQGRLGNILCRPALRAHEIAYLARPGAEAIPLTDLLVSLVNGRVVLHSRRLGREVIPRLTSAHAVGPGDLPLYRFLTALQGQDLPLSFAWSWGPLAAAPRLPRVTLGRVVLAPATWTFRAAELASLVEARGAARFRAAAELRQGHGLPRWIAVGDSDQRLVLDLDNVLAVDSFAELARARDRQEVTVQELYPAPETSCVRGAGGRYTHEIVIPFVRTDAPAVPALPPATPGGLPRSFAPGSQWLTLNCYCGPTVVDRILREVVSPLLSQHPVRWFFLRYQDAGGHHLRLRLHGPRAALHAELLPTLHDGLAPLLAAGVVGRVQLDTYHREIERYGGPQAMPVVEEIFHHDSAAALAIVELLEGDQGAEARWRLALRATHDLMVDFDLDLAARLALVTDLRARFGREHAVDVRLERQLGQRFRAERSAIAELLVAPGADHPLAPGLEALARRSAAVAPLAAGLSDGVLTTAPRTRVIAALLHMTANRLLLNQQRSQELVLHDFLVRHYTSQLARARPRNVSQAG
jgi:thiopeptide-type bacteriocin biosynthesis protein